MPTYQPTLFINGVPKWYDTVDEFANEWNRVIDDDTYRVWQMLEEHASLLLENYDSTYDVPTFEAVRMPRHEYHMDKDVFRGMSVKRISKRKEVK